jgi:hypothetical protein
MGLKIWLAATNSTHAQKNLRLLQGLRERGHVARIICLDNFLSGEGYSTIDQLRKGDLPYDVVPARLYRHELFGLSRMPRVAALLRSLQRSLLAKDLRAFLREKGPPDVVLFGADEGLISRTFVKTVRRFGIGTVLIVDGVVLPEEPRLRQGGFFRSLGRECRSYLVRSLHGHGARGHSGVDLILVMNDTAREALVQQRVPGERIVVVGSPEYDALAESIRTGSDDSARVRERLGLRHGRSVVFFAHQDFGQDDSTSRQMVREMVEGCRRAGATLLAKLHPRASEGLDTWRHWAEREGMGPELVVFVKDECTSVEAMRLCAACATVYSTVALEALACCRPLVLIHDVGAPFELHYGSKYGAALEVHGQKDLAPAIASVVLDRGVRESLVANIPAALEGELFGLDGRSLPASIAAIERLAAGSHD